MYRWQQAFVYPLAYDGRAVEAFRYLPRHAVGAQLALHVACCKVYADGDSVIVSMGELLWDRLPETAYSHDKLCLIVYLPHEIWQEERLVVLQQG